MKRASILVLAGFALATIVAACGKEGDLDRAGPMWGPKSRADYSAAKRDQAEQASNAAAEGATAEEHARRLADLDRREGRYQSIHFITLALFILFGVLLLIHLSNKLNPPTITGIPAGAAIS